MGPETKATDLRARKARHLALNLICRATGYRPHAGQVPFHMDQHRFRCLKKGRRGGGTTAIVHEILAESLLWEGIDYADIGIFAQNRTKTDIVWSRLWSSLVDNELFGPGSIVRATQSPRLIQTEWGARMMAFSLGEEGPGEGYGYRMAVFDETQLISYPVWLESVRPALGELGGRAGFVGKAKGVGFRRLAENEIEAPNLWQTHSFVSTANPLVSEEEIEEARAAMPRWLFRQEFEAIFSDIGTAVFDREHVYACVDDSLNAELNLGPKGDHWYSDGWDLARKQDETVGITLRATEAPYPVVAMWGGNREPWPVLTGRIDARWKRYDSARVTIDATGLGDVVSQYLDIPESVLDPFIFSPKSKSPLLLNLQALLERREIRLPRDQRLLSQLVNYDWDDAGLETDYVMALALAAWGITSRTEARIRWLSEDGSDDFSEEEWNPAPM